jgi:hypothetical protein
MAEAGPWQAAMVALDDDADAPMPPRRVTSPSPNRRRPAVLRHHTQAAEL